MSDGGWDGMRRVGRGFEIALAAVGIAIWIALVLPAAVRAQPAVSNAVPLKLYIFDCGIMSQRDGVPYGLSLEQLPPRDLSDPCALVVHPRGKLLWETGLSESVNSTPVGAAVGPGRPHPGDHVDKTLKRQLEEIGYRPADITYLALSHSHWDHTGNVSDYLQSVWLVQKQERDVMFGERSPPNRSDFAGLRDSRTELLDGDHDVFGDGTVILLFTPGHTPGHQSLFVRLPRTGPVILSGDLYHFPEEISLKVVPSGRGAEQVTESRKKIQALVTSTGAQLWIQHDILGYAKLRKSPAYFD